jgi:formylglycine-generating enzyme required for sulfatase activity
VKHFEESSDELVVKLAESRRKKRLYLLVATLLFAPAAILLLAQAFTLRITPVDVASNVEIAIGQGMLFQVGDNWILFSTTGTLLLQAPGYHETSLELEKPLNRSEYHIDLKPLPGWLSVSINAPQPYRLYVQNVQTSENRSSNRINVSRGNLTLELEGDYFETQSKEIMIEGKGVEQEIDFFAEAILTDVFLEVLPSNASLSVNGEAINREEGKFQLGMGTHLLTVEAAGYLSDEVEVKIESPEVVRLLSIELKLKLISATFTSEPSEAVVRIEGKFTGMTPLQTNLLPGKKYQVSVFKSGFVEKKIVVNAVVEKAISRRVILSARRIPARFESNVPASVQINGMVIGRTPIEYLVQEADVIIFSEPEYASQRIIVDGSHLSNHRYLANLVRANRFAFVSAPESVTVSGIHIKKFDGGQVPTDLLYLPTARISSADIKVLPFYSASREITEEQYAAIMELNTPSRQSNLPKRNLTWLEAGQFCNKLSVLNQLEPFYIFEYAGETRTIKENRAASGFRLPTHAEWMIMSGLWLKEKSQRVYYWGNSIRVPRNQGNFAGREANDEGITVLGQYVDEHKTVAPVGSYPANDMGLYDIDGNVSEWLHDFALFGTAASNKQERLDMFGPTLGVEHLVKGGSYKTGDLESLRIAHVRKSLAKTDDVGFRVVRTIQ